MRIKFTKFGANTNLGGFAPGDAATVSDELAKHLVEELGVAEYAEAAPKKKADKPEPEPVEKHGKSKR